MILRGSVIRRFALRLRVRAAYTSWGYFAASAPAIGRDVLEELFDLGGGSARIGRCCGPAVRLSAGSRPSVASVLNGVTHYAIIQ